MAEKALAMPLSNLSFPRGPYRYSNGERLIADLTLSLGEAVHDYLAD